jgi:hypothetical protein
MTVDEAIKIAKAEVKDAYALAYLNAIPQAIELGGQFNEAIVALKVQILYALSNMKSWRGEKARETKLVLKKFATL